MLPPQAARENAIAAVRTIARNFFIALFSYFGGCMYSPCIVVKGESLHAAFSIPCFTMFCNILGRI